MDFNLGRKAGIIFRMHNTGFTVSSTGYRVWILSDIQTIVNSYVGGTVLTSLPRQMKEA